jgi:aminocarboxymuconate-semialdehyde decarboxylase
MSRPVIDFHVHMLEPETYDAQINHNVVSGFGLRQMARPLPDNPRRRTFERMTDPELQIKEQAALGIDMHVVSLSTVSQSSWFAAPDEAARMDRRANARIAQWVARHPAHLIGSFSLPMQDMKLALRELDYAHGTLGLKVANMSSNSGGAYLGDPKFGPFWEAVEALDIPVWIHPHGVQGAEFQKYALWNGVGQPIEETLVIASIIYEGIFESFPKVKVIMAHGGGYLPHYIGRLDRNYSQHPVSTVNLKRLPSEYLKCFYFDTCVYATSVLENLIRQVGVERIVLGSDYPVGEKDPVGFIRQCANLSESDVAMITQETPARLLGLAH